MNKDKPDQQKQRFLPLLPSVYTDYIDYYKKRKNGHSSGIKRIRRVLSGLYAYLEEKSIEPHDLEIKHVDDFLAGLKKTCNLGTIRLYSCNLRGFLSYLYYERGVLSKDLAQFVKTRRNYGMAKPPKFLRPDEIKKLCAGLNTSSPNEIRTYATVHIAYTMGLRPIEISKITLDDISFHKHLLTVKSRKSNNPVELPIPEHTLKAISAYIIAGRPQSENRALFVKSRPPHKPVNDQDIARFIKDAMKRVGIRSSAYWLRHTYAQNLLEAGASVFEIKEMLGHDKIESTRIYLHVHVKLMRKSLFDEEI